jgi:nucleoid-associated protein YgaU
MASLTTPARVVVLFTAIALVLILLLANAVGAAGPDEPEAFETRLVVGGDTLWDIAGEHTPPGDDVRDTIFDIRRLNDLDGSVIVPGQVLRIPAG